MPNVITRKQWGAKHPDGFRDRTLPVKEFWLHHSVTIAPDLKPPYDDDDAAVRTLERIGQQRFKGGISYTYAVTPVGRFYEGHSLGRQGAHTAGHNTIGAAFVLVGDYSRHDPTDAQCQAIAEQMVELHRTGKATRHTLNGGHRDASGNSTSCPGDAGHRAITTINTLAEKLWAGGKLPTTSTGDGGKVTVLRPGDTGAAVGKLQAGLKRVFPAYAGRLLVDNSYGPATRAAVLEFQTRARVTGRYRSTLDGIAGPATIAALKTYGIEIAA